MALYYLNQYISKTLETTGGIDASQTSDIELPDLTGLDIANPGVACISYTDPLDTDNAEWITYTSIDNVTKKFQGVVRGQEGFSAKSHAKGVTIAFPISKSHINKLNDQFETAGDGFKQISTPSNPSSGRNKLYFKSDDNLYKLTSGGTETAVGSPSYAWTTWTPDFGNLTEGNGTLTGRYVTIDKTVIAEAHLVFGSTTSISGTITCDLPVSATNYSSRSAMIVGNAIFSDAGQIYFGHCYFDSSNTVLQIKTIDATVTYAQYANITSTVPFTWTTGDILSFQISYEVA